MLCADGKPNGILFDALVRQFFFTQLAVSSGSRVNDQVFDVCHVCQQRENLQVVDKLVGFSDAAFYLKGKDGSAAIWEIPLNLF